MASVGLCSPSMYSSSVCQCCFYAFRLQRLCVSCLARCPMCIPCTSRREGPLQSRHIKSVHPKRSRPTRIAAMHARPDRSGRPTRVLKIRTSVPTRFVRKLRLYRESTGYMVLGLEVCTSRFLRQFLRWYPISCLVLPNTNSLSPNSSRSTPSL